MGTPTHIQHVNEQRRFAGLERVERVARLYLQGHTLTRIAEIENVSRKAVNESIAKAREIWTESAAAAIAEHKARELAKIDQVENEAWDAWRRSQEDEVIREVGETPKGSTRKRRRRGQVGDGVFLGIIQKCVDQRIKLLGLDSPEAGGAAQTALLEVVISSRAEAAKILPYAQFEEFSEGA